MKYTNILTGDRVLIKSTATVEGVEVVNYQKIDNKQRSEFGMVIDQHTKPAYVFTATYKEGWG